MIQYHRCPGCATIFTKEAFVANTENDNSAERNTPVRYKQILERVFPLEGAYMDYGCGNGEFVAWLNKHVESVRAVGVDLHTGLTIQDFADEWLSGIFMIEVIEHLQDPLKILRELYHKLKPGGFIYIESTFADSIKDHKEHPYVDPKIGHRVILSRLALSQFPMQQTWINPHVLIMRKE